jgi:hypothetical protein
MLTEMSAFCREAVSGAKGDVGAEKFEKYLRFSAEPGAVCCQGTSRD